MSREGADRVEIYNEGLVVFLYDETKADEIKEADPSILSGFGDEDAADPRLAELAAQGTLVAYEKLQDDELNIDVVVGPPLTDDELIDGGWTLPQHSFLSLPSGRLRIDGYNSLPIGPEEPDEDGAVIDVPPGDYIVTLYRVDPVAMDAEDFEDLDEDLDEDDEDENEVAFDDEEDELDEGDLTEAEEIDEEDELDFDEESEDDDENERPDEVVVLTPLGKEPRPTEIPPMLTCEFSGDDEEDDEEEDFDDDDEEFEGDDEDFDDDDDDDEDFDDLDDDDLDDDDLDDDDLDDEEEDKD